MNENFIDGFEKIAWNPIQGLGQVSRGVKAVGRAVGRAGKAGSGGISNAKAYAKQSYRRGRYGTIQAHVKGKKYSTGASSPYNPGGPRPEVLRSKGNIAQRKKYQRLLDIDAPARAIRKKGRVISQRRKNISGRINPMQEGNTTAKYVTGGLVGAAAVTGIGAGRKRRQAQQQQMPQQQFQRPVRRYA